MSLAEIERPAITHDLPPAPRFVTEAHHPEFNWTDNFSTEQFGEVAIQAPTVTELTNADIDIAAIRPDLITYRDKFPLFMRRIDMRDDARWLAEVIHIADKDAPVKLVECDFLLGVVQAELHDAYETTESPEQKQFFGNAMQQVHALGTYITKQCRQEDGLTVGEAIRDYEDYLIEKDEDLKKELAEREQERKERLQKHALSFASREAFRTHRLGTPQGNREVAQNVINTLRVTPVDMSERKKIKAETLVHRQNYQEFVSIVADEARRLGIDLDRRGVKQDEFWEAIKTGSSIAIQAAQIEMPKEPDGPKILSEQYQTTAQKALALIAGE